MVMKIHEMEMRAEGRAEGRAQGKDEQKAEDARAMYDDGLEPERIARILKLELSDVEVMLGLRKMAWDHLVPDEDVNDKSVTEAAEADQELQHIRAEIHGMAQDREVQNMIIQERYDRMDWLTYGSEREAAGEARGEIKGAIKLYSEEMNLQPVDIVQKIISRFSLKQPEAEQYVMSTLGLQKM